MTMRAGARFEGNAVIVTGAGSGIGRAIAVRFAEEGARVAVNDLAPESAERVAGEIRSAGGDAVAVAGDVGDEDDARSIVASASEAFGRLDVLVNNAAAFVYGSVEEAGAGEWAEAFRVNVSGAALMSKYAMPLLAASGAGAIVNISSVGAIMGSAGMTPYGTSKAAMLGLTRCLAVEAAPLGVRVNAVCPGCFWTPALERLMDSLHFDRVKGEEVWGEAMLLKRFAEPEELAASVAFLASREASYITGTHLVVDGGITTK